MNIYKNYLTIKASYIILLFIYCHTSILAAEFDLFGCHGGKISNDISGSDTTLFDLSDPKFHQSIAVRKDWLRIEPLPTISCSNSTGRCTWERTFGGPLPDKSYDIAVLPDGGVVAVGHTKALKGIGYDIKVLRVDWKGDVVWERQFGGLEEDHSYGVVTNKNGDIVVTGYTRSKGKGLGDVWVCKMDIDGSQIWEYTFGGVLDDRARTITASHEGKYIVAGTTQSKGAPEGDAWVIKLNENGSKVWDKTFGGDGEDGIFQIKALPDGSIIATGYSDKKGEARFDMWILKLNAMGDVIWDRQFGESVFDAGTSIESTFDGGCIVAGITIEDGYHNDQALILRLDPEGELVWQRILGGVKSDSAWALIKRDLSSFIVVIATSSKGAGSADAWIVCLDINGTKIWDRIYGGELWDRPTSAAKSEDGSLFIGGYTTSKGAGYEDFWIMRLDSGGNL